MIKESRIDDISLRFKRYTCVICDRSNFLVSMTKQHFFDEHRLKTLREGEKNERPLLYRKISQDGQDPC